MQPEEFSKISTIVRTTRLELSARLGKSIPQEQFGEMLVEGLVDESISGTSVSAWETERYEPDDSLLWKLVVRHYGTQAWQLLFAMQCLRAKLPDVFENGIVNIEFPVAG